MHSVIDFSTFYVYNILLWITMRRYARRQKKGCWIMTRREAREIVFTLLFETEFRPEDDYEEIFAVSLEERDILPNDYIRSAYHGTLANRAAIDEKIAKNAKGWKTERMTKVSRSILRLAVYEMLFCPDIPASVSINEAIELAKKYDDDKARAFINGILNGVKDSLAAEGNVQDKTADGADAADTAVSDTVEAAGVAADAESTDGQDNA